MVPDNETRYGVGTERLMDDGIVKATRRVLPTIVVTALAFVVAKTPPAAAGWRVTVVLAGRIVPLGKFEPVTLMIVTPGAPAVGAADGLNVTCVCAQRVAPEPNAQTIKHE